MDISVRWLRELAADLRGSAEELAERLSLQAVPVDGVRTFGAGLEPVVVARVLEVRPHPNADRLLLCVVDPGGDAVEVVCGAPMVKEGALYPFIPPGGTLPDGPQIESRKIRGVLSHGMLCSEAELRLGRDRSGILELPADLEPGEPLGPGLGMPDELLLVDLTPNRVDLACHLGVARELAEGGIGDLRLADFGVTWEPKWAEGTEGAEGCGVRVAIDAPDRCLRYLGAVVRGVRVGPSPAWLAGRLRALGLRPVNNVVDATNFVLFELNQPLHAFDLHGIRGGEVRVRAAAPGERLRTLDGELRSLEPAATVIADAEGPIALAGVMGGEESEVTAETRDLFLECAAFDPLHTRHTARSVGLSTDASYRFERGIDPTGQERALRRCVELILHLAGGVAEAEAIRVGVRPDPRVVTLRAARIRRVLGLELEPGPIQRLLEPLGFQVAGDGEGTLGVTVPGWRGDVEREIDLIEEVARRHGYGAFPDRAGSFRASVVPDDPVWRKAGRARRWFVSRGFLEARSSSFVPERQPGGRAEVAVRNPLSAAEAYLRAAIVPVLLRRLEHNWARGRRDVRLFEVGTVFFRDPEASGLDAYPEEIRVGAVLTGLRDPVHWSGDAREADLWDLKGLAEEVARYLMGADLEPMVEAPAPKDRWGMDWLGEGGFRIHRSGDTVGVAGPVRGEAVDPPPWAAPVWGVEFRLDAVESAPHRLYRESSPYPPVRRDLAVAVPLEVPAAEIESRIREAGRDLLESLVLFDVYEGRGVEPGRRSLAWSLRFRAPDRTLTDEEVETAMRRIVSELEQNYDARVRSA